MAQAAPRGKHWVFTYNFPEDYDEPDEETCEELAQILWSKLGTGEFAVLQLERAPSTDRLHFQGTFSLTERVRRTQLVTLMTPEFSGIHLELRRGTMEQAVEYSSKEETRICGPFRFGTQPHAQQGRRTDIEKAMDLLKTGKTPAAVAMEIPSSLRLYSQMQAFQADIMQDRSEQTRFIWIYGPSGSGKSVLASEMASRLCGGSQSVYHKNPSNKWWFRYTGQEVVVFDNFATDSMSWTDFCTLGDASPLYRERKGGSVSFCAKYVIFTSVWSPEDYHACQDPRSAKLCELWRRVYFCLNMSVAWRDRSELCCQLVDEHSQKRTEDAKTGNYPKRVVHGTPDNVLEQVEIDILFPLRRIN